LLLKACRRHGSRSISDPARLQASASLRKQFEQPCAAAAGDELTRDLHRDLGDYDSAFGLIDDLIDKQVVS